MERYVPLGFIAMLLAIVALALPAANTNTAHAATMTPLTDTTHCSTLGTLIETDPITAGGTTFGYLNIYYNSANGYNCAEATSASSYYGVKKIMVVVLTVCTQTRPGSTCTAISYDKPYSDSDSGYYSYYAGPVGVYGKGHCIAANAQVEGATYATWGASHCS